MKKEALQKAAGQWIVVKARTAEKRRERDSESRADRVEEARASSSSSQSSNNEDDYEEEVVEYGTVSDSGYSMLVAGQLVRLPKVSELDEERRDLLFREDKMMGGIRIVGGKFRGFYHEQPNRPLFVDIEGKKFWDDMGLRREVA